MKKTILAVALAAASVSAFAGGSSYVSHQSSFAPLYAGVNGGMNLVRGTVSGAKISDMVNHGYNLGAFFGYRFNENLRADVSVDWIRNALKAPADSIHVNQYAFLANVYYDVTQFNMAGFVPYVGAGIGWDHFTANFDNQKEDMFAWQLAGGVNYDFSSNMAFGVGYRLLTVKKDGVTAYNNLVNASLTYKFAM